MHEFERTAAEDEVHPKLATLEHVETPWNGRISKPPTSPEVASSADEDD